MRRIFSLFLLMAFTINICAIDELQIKPHQTIAGLSDESDDAYIELYLVNESFDIANLQFDILLPEGMEYADYGEFTDRVPSTTKKGNKTYDFSYQTNVLEDGYTRFMFIPGGEMRKIEKGSGTILYINFKTNANMAAGIHPILMKNIKLVESTTSAITIDDVSSYVIIGDNNPLKTETDINMSSLIGSIPSFVVQAINADIASNAGLKYIDLTGADALGADFVMPNDQAKLVVKEGSPLANLSYAVTSKEPAVEGIAINETNFPDANFRSYLLEQSYGSDGVITDEEIAGITLMIVDGKSIQSLKGIEFFTALAILRCSNNQLTALDVSNNKELIYLDCSHNKLATLNVTGCTALGKPYFLGEKGVLYCAGNQIKGAAMDAFVESLPENANKCKLQIIDKENEGNVITAAQVAAAKAKGWKPLALNEEDNKWYSYLGSDVPTPEPVEINETNFPDEIFRNYVSSKFDKNGDGKLSFYEGQRGDMEPDGLGIKSLKGIEFFTEIEGLYCHDNLLTELDVSKNTALKELYCSRNQLKSLDVSKNTALTTLNCGDNQLTALDVSKNTALTTLNCYGNQLTALDISGCTALEELYCSNNQLTTLDVSGCTALTELSCSLNQLTALDVSKNTALTELSCSRNQLTALDVSKNTALTTLSCYSNQLTALNVSGCTALTWLHCHYNQLTSLDVSKNTALTWLECNNNKLTALNVSKNTALTWLNCSYNQLTTLDVSGCTALTGLSCSNNQLTTLDVSKNTALTSLFCYSNQLTALDLSNNTALTELYCWNNQLTTLDVSKNTLLESLNCSNNQLTALDVSKNAALEGLTCHNNQIKGAGMDALVSSLPTQSDASLYVIYNENEGNVMTTTQVAAAKEKGWKPKYYDGTDWQEYAGSDPTAIEGIESDTSASKNGSDVYFDLSGRRVTAPTKGVYVKNGKKVVVK